MRVILASSSSFRKRALDILGLKYDTMPSNFDEKSIRVKDPFELAKKLSEAKVKEIGDKEEDAIIISGDLFVVFNNKIYEKPKDNKDAFDMLSSFSDNKIDIIAGVAVFNSKTKELLSSSEKYSVKFRKLSKHEIEDYISRYPVLKCSASFEGDGLIRFAESVEGKFPFLTGFPMNSLIDFLRKNGLEV